jgi:hypothetical protein
MHYMSTAFQIIRCFSFSRFIVFAMHLDYTMFIYIVEAMYFEKPKRLIRG